MAPIQRPMSPAGKMCPPWVWPDKHQVGPDGCLCVVIVGLVVEDYGVVFSRDVFHEVGYLGAFLFAAVTPADYGDIVCGEYGILKDADAAFFKLCGKVFR